MTNEEAMQIISKYDLNFKDTEGNPIPAEKIAMAMDMAINSLRIKKPNWKEFPKKVLYEGDGYEDGNMVFDMARCPYCDRVFDEDQDSWEATYCPDCGQRLDWK